MAQLVAETVVTGAGARLAGLQANVQAALLARTQAVARLAEAEAALSAAATQAMAGQTTLPIDALPECDH
jgi:Tfp pilus assembly PilM family ATPase